MTLTRQEIARLGYERSKLSAASLPVSVSIDPIPDEYSSRSVQAAIESAIGQVVVVFARQIKGEPQGTPSTDVAVGPGG